MQSKHSLNNILFLSSTDSAFLAHRVPMALGAAELSKLVVVVCKDTGKSEEIKRLGFKFVGLPDSSVRLLLYIKNGVFLINLYKIYRPEIVHHSSVLMSFIGSVANLLFPLQNKSMLSQDRLPIRFSRLQGKAFAYNAESTTETFVDT